MNNRNYFTCEKVSSRVTRIFTITGECVYLVEGKDKAVLIDTGTGIGDLKTLVETMTNKPLRVVLSHGHVDHVMGAANFDHIYMNVLDQVVLEEHQDVEFSKSYAKMVLGAQGNEIPEEAYVPQKSLTYTNVLPGDVFDLGGLKLEICEGKGHTPGSITILLHEERLLFLGDACNPFTFLFDHHASDVTSYKKTLEILNEKTKGKYDKVLLSHGNGEGPKEMIESVIAVCDEVIHQKADDQPFEFMGQTAFIAKAMSTEMKRVDGGVGNIVYDKNKMVALENSVL